MIHSSTSSIHYFSPRSQLLTERVNWSPTVHNRKWTTPEERNALIGACLEVDVNRSGEIPANSVEKVLSTVDSEVRERNGYITPICIEDLLELVPVAVLLDMLHVFLRNNF